MSKQAKTLTEQEMRQVLNHISTRKHAARNRALLLMTHYAGLRVGEVAALRYQDVLDAAGVLRNEIRLEAFQTKGNEGNVVFISEKLKKELSRYLRDHPCTEPSAALFSTQKQRQRGFTANTLTQFFHHLYRAAGLDGASSHTGRRSFITKLAAKGVGVRVLMSLARHKHISTTQRYIDVNDDMMRKAVELI